MLIDRLNKNLENYQKENNELNDGEKILFSLSNSIREIVNKSVAEANDTDSVDERINSLLGGLQSVLLEINKRQQDFLKDRAVLQIKIQTLEDLLLSDIESMDNSEGLDAEE